MEYSVIIPHKNIPTLLQRCLDSIPSRSDLQVIVVDDNSDPTIVDFEHFPGSDRDDLTLVFTKEGKGAGYARNVGMKHATGKWLLFADADDFFHEGMLEMLDKWKDTDSQIVFFRTDSADSDTLNKMDSRAFYIDYNDEHALRYESFIPWGKILLSSFIKDNDIQFEEVPFANDMMFSLVSGHLAKAISVSDDTLYRSTYRRDSLVRINTVDAIKTRLDTRFRCLDYCRKNQITTGMFNYNCRRNIIELKSIDRTEYYKQLIRYLFKEDKRTVGHLLIEKLKPSLEIRRD